MSKKVIVQKYIERPLLFENRKFDIRLYLMVSHSGKVYTYREMYIRVSAYPFELENLGKFGHLNNIALQKYSKNYDGEKAIITPHILQDFVRRTLWQQFCFDKHIRPKLRQISAILARVITEKFRATKSIKRNFEIFGLDFMIDRDFGVWFIEANTNPAITTGNSYLDQLIPRMLDDAFKLTIDKMFSVPRLESHFTNRVGVERTKEVISHYDNTHFPLEGFKDKDNLWNRIQPEEMELALKTNVN